ncbi:unnamed protein product [marine sediment metagenome]|uniref:Uncharacterized protein n=1 Tax=marine sediment metagenome TaxID=412755 RepID=X0W692_9ZZZZ
MEELAAISGILFILITIFLIIVAVLALLMPFFVWSIRNQMLKLNEQIAGIDKKIIIANNNLVKALKKMA